MALTFLQGQHEISIRYPSRDVKIYLDICGKIIQGSYDLP